MASEALMKQLTNIKAATSTELASPAGKASQHANPIGALLEMAQKGKFAPPEFVLTTLQSVPPEFKSVATVTINGQRHSFTATSNTKQEAKKISAAIALNACGIDK